jgi:hypothetical protein
MRRRHYDSQSHILAHPRINSGHSHIGCTGSDMAMTSQTRKHRGYKTQRNVAEYMASLFPNAYAAGAGQSGSDILGTPFNIEVKARTGFEPLATFRQLESRSDGRFGFVVLRCNGQGDDAGEYLVMARLKDFMPLLADTWEGK